MNIPDRKKYLNSFMRIRIQNLFDSGAGKNSDRVLRNADLLYIPQHNYASLKRMPLFNFPRVWNTEDDTKLIPIQHRYLKLVKNNCLLNLI